MTDKVFPPRKIPAIQPSFFGRHARYMLASYLQHSFMVAAALMTVALTIDLWPQIPLLTADPAQNGLDVAWNIARLAALRLCDLLPPFIPFATFLGVVWSEIVFTTSQERMLIWNSGRSPLQCLAPALMAGLLMGAALFIIDAYLRPAAIAVQIAERFGREGIRLDRTQSGGSHWLALPDGLLRAEIEYGPPLRLHDTTIYKFDADGLLREVDTAALASPLPDNQWLLQEGHYWKAEAGAALTLGDTHEEPETPFDQRKISLKLDVQRLGNLGMSPQYLTLPMLQALAHSPFSSAETAGFRTRLQAVFGETLLPGAMALLAALLAMLFFPYRIKPISLIGVLLAGYLAHFAFTAFLLMGEFGYVTPAVAGWLIPLLILVGASGVLYRIQKRRGLGFSLRDTPPLGRPNSG